MEVMIANSLEMPIHIAVVRHSPLALEFVISPQRVPIPCGTVKRRDDIEPDHALLMGGLGEGVEFSAMRVRGDGARKQGEQQGEVRCGEVLSGSSGIVHGCSADLGSRSTGWWPR